MEKKWMETSIQEKVAYLHHKVSVITIDNKEIVGWVYTIDPVTNSLVLHESGYLTTILGHAVFTIVVLSTPTPAIKNTLDLLLEDDRGMDPFHLSMRKTCLANWLKRNRFPVEVFENKITVARTLNIFPPYNTDSCETRNEIILGRIQNLIELMPERC